MENLESNSNSGQDGKISVNEDICVHLDKFSMTFDYCNDHLVTLGNLANYLLAFKKDDANYKDAELFFDVDGEVSFMDINFRGIKFQYNIVGLHGRKSRNSRVEFNPTHIDSVKLLWLTKYVFNCMDNTNITRLDVTFDVFEDLSGFQPISKYKQGLPQVNYRSYFFNGYYDYKRLGTHNSKEQIVLYDHLSSLKKLKKIPENSPDNWYHVEFRLRDDKVKQLDKILEDFQLVDTLHFKNSASTKDKAMVYYLNNGGEMGGDVSKRTWDKYKNLTTEITTMHYENRLQKVWATYSDEIHQELEFYSSKGTSVPDCLVKRIKHNKGDD